MPRTCQDLKINEWLMYCQYYLYKKYMNLYRTNTGFSLLKSRSLSVYPTYVHLKTRQKIPKRDNQNSQERQTKTRLKQKTKKKTNNNKTTLKNWASPGIRACAPVHLDSSPVGKLIVPGKPCLCKEEMPSKFTSFSYTLSCRVDTYISMLT